MVPRVASPGQVSARLGVTVRALHHRDEIGPARPSLRTGAGYRLCTAADLERLHRVVVHRAIGLGPDRGQAVLDDAGTDVPAALRAQRAQVAERVERLQRLGAGLDRMIEAHERGLLLTVEQQAAIFGPDWDPEGPVKARQRCGDTLQRRQYAERSAARTYASDPGFAAHCGSVRPGLAAWFRTVVDASARAHGIDPDTVAWR